LEFSFSSVLLDPLESWYGSNKEVSIYGVTDVVCIELLEMHTFPNGRDIRKSKMELKGSKRKRGERMNGKGRGKGSKPVIMRHIKLRWRVHLTRKVKLSLFEFCLL